ncbi:hypothetical protein [Flavobacterium adhaerens]|uniref:hypothetical protein n=1 Tax=Flavobacterium adhaerens TaxID=3149043 RepID=UPI0032B3CCEC
MRNFRNFIVFILSTFILCCCFRRVDNKELIISNKSSNSIYITLSSNDEIFDYEKFLLNERLEKGEEINGTIDITGLFFSEEISPNSIINWKPATYFKGYIDGCNDEKTRIFIIEKDSVKKYGWKQLHKMKLYNKKYILSYNELEKNNWKINY